MNYKKIRALFIAVKNAYESIGAETELVIEEPASIAEVEAIENRLERKLPLQIREFFLQFSRRCQFSAWLPDDFKRSDELDEISSAVFLISLEEAADAENSRKAWIEDCFTDETDEYDLIWYHKLGFMNVANGDVIAFDLQEDEINPPVIYLSHDDGEGHGYILGKDFNTYFEQLLLIGACGNEDWQMLPFCSDAGSGIESECKNAKEYRGIIGLRV